MFDADAGDDADAAAADDDDDDDDDDAGVGFWLCGLQIREGETR